MIEEETAGRLDIRAFRHAVERRDADALLGFYSDGSELRIVNGEALEDPAFELRGRAEIHRYLRAVCDQEMTCAIEGEIVFGEESVEFSEACEYQDGTWVLVRTTLGVHGGKILRQLDVVERQS
jgi:hypothetical protein